MIDYIMFVNEGLFLNKIYVYMCICKTSKLPSEKKVSMLYSP